MFVPDTQKEKNKKQQGEGKYHNKKITFQGETFDSKKEFKRFLDLRILEKNGDISHLRRQVKYELISAKYEECTIGKRGAVKHGKCIASACCYYADFVYVDNATGNVIVEDCKGVRTAAYNIKKKLMLDKYGIEIKET